MNRVMIVVVSMFIFLECTLGLVTSPEALKALVTAMTPTETSPGCIDFTPYVGPSVFGGIPPSDSFKSMLLKTLITETSYRCIMTYESDPVVAQTCNTLGIKMLSVVWLDPTDTGANSVQIQAGITVATKYPTTVLGLSCGSELAFRNGASPSILSIIQNCVNRLRSAGVKQPIGTNDSEAIWMSATRWMAPTVFLDFIGANIYPWYDNASPSACTPATKAGMETFLRYQKMMEVYSNTQVIVTEAGWPRSNNMNQPITNKSPCGVASNENQIIATQDMITLFKNGKYPFSLFLAFGHDYQPVANNANIEDFWGICIAANNKYSCVDVFNNVLQGANAGLSGGAVAGIVISVLFIVFFVVACVVVVVILVVIYKKRGVKVIGHKNQFKRIHSPGSPTSDAVPPFESLMSPISPGSPTELKQISYENKPLPVTPYYNKKLPPLPVSNDSSSPTVDSNGGAWSWFKWPFGSSRNVPEVTVSSPDSIKERRTEGRRKDRSDSWWIKSSSPSSPVTDSPVSSPAADSQNSWWSWIKWPATDATAQPTKNLPPTPTNV
ncbi:beta-glucosidase [Acrasis kona]|uniref:glucan endo-1,3-beta-D-glucosidase n=1 Tax=Acrasis kona TaxID=1008807 RepID=A0AAW2Z0Z0_9EUKA